MHGIAFRTEAIGFPPSRPSCSFFFTRKPGLSSPLRSPSRRSVATTPKQTPRDGRPRPYGNERTLIRATSSIPNVPLLHDTQETLSSSYHVAPTTSDVPSEKAQFTHLLRTRDPDTLLAYLTQSRGSRQLVASLPRTTFLEILRVLKPSHFITPIREADRFIEPYSTTDSFPGNRSLHTLLKRPTLQKRFDAFMSQINQIMSARRRGGQALAIAEYSYLLDCARLMGDNDMASGIWSVMHSVEVAPDSNCFNYFMEARCWGKAYYHEERDPQNLRVIPLNYHKRKLPDQDRPLGFRGHRTGPDGLLPEIQGIFQSMVEKGEPADMETFSHLMTALAREGDMGGVKRILRDVWKINVDDILAFDGSAFESANSAMAPKQFPRTSALFPSTRLLFIIVHVFSINNDCASAMRLVDFVSRHYSIPISVEVWEHLTTWAYTLSKNWSKSMRTKGHSVPVTKKVVMDLWETMWAEPYNVVPTMRLHNYVVMSLGHRDNYYLMLQMMREARPLYNDTQYRRYHAIEKHMLEDAENNGFVSPPTQRKAELAVMENQEAFNFIRLWVKFLLKGDRFPGRLVLEFQLRAFPQLIREWSFFLSQIATVQTSDFKVEIQTDQIPVAFEDRRFRNRQQEVRSVEPDSSIFILPQSLKASEDEEFL